MWWSWILTAVGLTGFILAGRKIWWCWYINIACQALWFAYAIFTEQYGFIVASIAYTFVFTQNAVKWTRERNMRRMRVYSACNPDTNGWCLTHRRYLEACEYVDSLNRETGP